MMSLGAQGADDAIYVFSQPGLVNEYSYLVSPSLPPSSTSFSFAYPSSGPAVWGLLASARASAQRNAQRKASLARARHKMWVGVMRWVRVCGVLTRLHAYDSRCVILSHPSRTRTHAVWSLFSLTTGRRTYHRRQNEFAWTLPSISFFPPNVHNNHAADGSVYQLLGRFTGDAAAGDSTPAGRFSRPGFNQSNVDDHPFIVLAETKFKCQLHQLCLHHRPTRMGCADSQSRRLALWLPSEPCNLRGSSVRKFSYGAVPNKTKKARTTWIHSRQNAAHMHTCFVSLHNVQTRCRLAFAPPQVNDFGVASCLADVSTVLISQRLSQRYWEMNKCYFVNVAILRINYNQET